MVVSPTGLTPKKDCAGEAHQQLNITDPSSRQIGCPSINMSQLSEENFHEIEGKYWSRVPDNGLIPGQTGRLTVGSALNI
jgi:hypothetical protein